DAPAPPETCPAVDVLANVGEHPGPGIDTPAVVGRSGNGAIAAGGDGPPERGHGGRAAVRVPGPLKWHGGKAYLAKKIVALMPPHLHYVEPYAGGLSVLLARDPEGTSEVVNDLDGRLVNFWRVLQDPETFERFRRRAEAVPLSRSEWEAASEHGYG